MNRLAPTSLVLLLTGCVQMEVHVKLGEDGSATVRERLWLSRQLLEEFNPSADARDLRDELSRGAAIKRAAMMAEDARLVSHQRTEREDGSESVAVIRVNDIQALRFQAPFPAVKGHTDGFLHFVVEPCYSTRWASPDQPGYMALHVKTAGIPRHQRPKTRVPRGITPKEIQQLRELRPTFKEMLRGFRFRFQV